MNIKIITPLVLLFYTATQIVAQNDTIYFDFNWKKSKKEEAKFYRPIPFKKVGDFYEFKDYHINGTIQMEGLCSNIKNQTFEGTVKWYYENGQLILF